MDSFEPHENSQPGLEPEPTAYRGAGAGRKESPYANSPYVAWQPQQEQPAQPPQPERTEAPAETPRQEYRRTYHYEPENPAQPPKKPRVRKKADKKVWKRIFAVAAALALVVGSCLITAGVVNSRWEARTDAMEAEFTRQFEELQNRIDAAGKPSNQIVIGNQVSAEGQIAEADCKSNRGFL